jgi:SP family arabinose:H+ symporter-like MFS transporter
MAGFYVISALGCAFAWDLSSLLLLRLIGGLGIAGSSVLGPMYIVEMAAPKWRGRLVDLFQINIVVGVLLAYVSNGCVSLLHLASTSGDGSLAFHGWHSFVEKLEREVP